MIHLHYTSRTYFLIQIIHLKMKWLNNHNNCNKNICKPSTKSELIHGVTLKAYHRRFPLEEVEHRGWTRTFRDSQRYIINGWYKWAHVTYCWNKSLKNNTDIHYIPTTAWSQWCLIDPWKYAHSSTLSTSSKTILNKIKPKHEVSDSAMWDVFSYSLPYEIIN